MRRVGLGGLIDTKVELPREKDHPEKQDQEQPRVGSWHLVGKTKLREEKLQGQGIRIPARLAWQQRGIVSSKPPRTSDRCPGWAGRLRRLSLGDVPSHRSIHAGWSYICTANSLGVWRPGNRAMASVVPETRAEQCKENPSV